MILSPRNRRFERAEGMSSLLDQRLEMMILLQCSDECKMFIVVLSMLT